MQRLSETVQRLSDRVHELEQERSRDRDVINILRKFDADLLRRVLDVGSQGVLAQDKQLWSAVKGFGLEAREQAKKEKDRFEKDPVKHLLLAGANPNGYKNKNGETALHVADAPGIVASLLASKAAVDAVDKEGNTPLHKAAEGQYITDAPGIVASLLASKVAVDAVDKKGNTPLHKAAAGDNKDVADVVTSLLASKAAVNAVSLDGKTPLDQANRTRMTLMAVAPSTRRR